MNDPIEEIINRSQKQDLHKQMEPGIQWLLQQGFTPNEVCMFIANLERLVKHVVEDVWKDFKLPPD